jgi:hypothetical protein
MTIWSFKSWSIGPPPAALAAHERTQAFIQYGRGVLVRRATLHDTVTGRPFA